MHILIHVLIILRLRSILDWVTGDLAGKRR